MASRTGFGCEARYSSARWMYSRERLNWSRIDVQSSKRVVAAAKLAGALGEVGATVAAGRQHDATPRAPPTRPRLVTFRNSRRSACADMTNSYAMQERAGKHDDGSRRRSGPSDDRSGTENLTK